MSLYERAPFRALMPNGKLGPEYGPISVRTGREVSHSLAEREYIAKYGSLHAIPVADDPGSQGNSPPTRHPRYDRESLIAWARCRSQRLSNRELEVYTLYWEQRMSLRETAEHLGIEQNYVHDLIKRIRRKAGIPRPL